MAVFEKLKDSEGPVFILGNKNHPDLKGIRVYFFDREDVFMDFEINMK